MILRANLPVAAFSTLVSNPFTFSPIDYAAYRLGALLLGLLVMTAYASALGHAVVMLLRRLQVTMS